MLTLKKIKKELETVSTIGKIANIYQDIARWRMNQIREEVLKNREFLEGMAETYSLAKGAYFASLKNKKKTLKGSLSRKRKNQVIVFLSAAEFFYGSLIQDIWKRVLTHLEEKGKSDLVVVGKVGKKLAEKSKLGLKMFYFELDYEKPQRKTIKEIVDFIKNYNKVVVFHGKYETVMTQKPIQIDISGGSFLKGKLVEEEVEEGAKEYLFEPSPKSVLEFFETEITATLFGRTILEHCLARYAARMISMYESSEKAKDMEKKLQNQEKRLKYRLSNKRQIELFGSFKLWS